jgi:phytoene dehydrogenase-like protein
VHIGGSSAEIIAAEQAVVDGDQCERPFVLLAQPSLIDPTRAPSGCHTAWAYCHVPNGSELDMTALIEKQVERFAPGFQKVILKRNVMFPRDLEHYNPNYVGGDIAGGAASLKQLLFRPRITLDPYQLQSTRFWICSSSTPPGPGVHGMCGYLAASSALKKLKFKQKEL